MQHLCRTVQVPETTMDQTTPLQYDHSAVIELRQYRLHAGRRDALIDLFDREFLESQETAGLRVIGQFRDANRPDHFVWLRGFPDMCSRAEALKAFYGGPAWKAHREAANATMVDSDDVLLLRPVDAESGFWLPKQRAAVGTSRPAKSLVMATVYLLTRPVDENFARFFDSRVKPLMEETGAVPIARLRTEYAHNTFPALPVRTGENAFVWFACFGSAADHARHDLSLSRSSQWLNDVRPALSLYLKSPAQHLLLEPTARSLLGEVGPSGYTTDRTGDVHDFDFLAGTWSIANRRLKRRGAASNEWDEFPATGHAEMHLGGVANTDEIIFPAQGWAGMTLRAFDLEKRQWSIYWINSRLGKLLPPVVGGFAGDRGEFYGEDQDEGRPVRVRFIWTRLGPDAARWEQAFASDGQAWETNWIMELKRVSAVDQQAKPS